jgi:hypothetical protein
MMAIANDHHTETRWSESVKRVGLALIAVLMWLIVPTSGAMAAVSCPGIAFVDLLSGLGTGVGAYVGQVTADARTKSCASNVPNPTDGITVIVNYGTTSPYAGLSVTSHTNGVISSGSLSCSGAGCSDISGNIGLFVPLVGAAVFTYKYVDSTGTTITVTLPASGGLGSNSTSVPGFTLSGGLWDSNSPAVTSFSPYGGSTFGGTAVTITGSNFTGAMSWSPFIEQPGGGVELGSRS